MPLAKLFGKRERTASPEPEEMEAPVKQPGQLPVEDELMEQGRPHQAFVEDEARRYWQEMVQAGNLSKPDLQELRAAALPVLGQAQRRRPGPKLNPALNRAHLAVCAMQTHFVERGLIKQPASRSEASPNHKQPYSRSEASPNHKQPYSRLEASPNHVEALIQLGDELGGLVHREIPLPDHPAPRHPPIYYTIDAKTKKPVPTKESLIRGDYVYDIEDGYPITEDEYIYPWQDPDNDPTLDDLTSRGWKACYTFSTSRTGSWDRRWDYSADGMRIIYFWIDNFQDRPELWSRSDRGPHNVGDFEIAKGGIYFSPHAPTEEDLSRRLMNKYDARADKFLFENADIIFS